MSTSQCLGNAFLLIVFFWYFHRISFTSQLYYLFSLSFSVFISLSYLSTLFFASSPINTSCHNSMIICSLRDSTMKMYLIKRPKTSKQNGGNKYERGGITCIIKTKLSVSGIKKCIQASLNTATIHM